ncbi:MAG: AtpZ/AtpI family protein, partial [Hyphomicrobiaceae bacterium]|nr:AtpZ/AtpI family protein [Hyphomicrobiaceae bacterium]
GGILVGSAMGYGLDLLFGTTPALFILFFLLGSAAGMLNVIRSSAPKQGDGAGKTTPQAVKDDDEDA